MKMWKNKLQRRGKREGSEQCHSSSVSSNFLNTAIRFEKSALILVKTINTKEYFVLKGEGKKKSSSVTMSDMMGMSEMTNKKITILQQMRLVIGLREWVSTQT